MADYDNLEYCVGHPSVSFHLPVGNASLHVVGINAQMWTTMCFDSPCSFLHPTGSLVKRRKVNTQLRSNVNPSYIAYATDSRCEDKGQRQEASKTFAV